MPAWLNRWVAEGMLVDSLDSTSQVRRLALGPPRRIAGVRPNGCITGIGRNRTRPWVVAIDPTLEIEVPSETEDTVVPSALAA